MLRPKHKTILVREYTPKDKPKIEILAKRVFNVSMDSYWAVRYLDKCDKALIAQTNGRIVGVVELGIKRLKSGLHGQIGYIFVDPDYRNMGIGSMLLEESLKFFKSIGVTAAWALTDRDNYATRTLFKKFGFKEFLTPKGLKGMYSRSEIFRLLRWMIYWVGDVILYKKL